MRLLWWPAILSTYAFAFGQAFLSPRLLQSKDAIQLNLDTKSFTSVSVQSHDGYDGMLWEMTEFFASMVDTETYRFYSLCLPPSGEKIHRHFPVRDIAAAWDATKLLHYWNFRSAASSSTIGDSQQSTMVKLEKGIEATLTAYTASFIPLEKNGIALDPTSLQEQPNIAHSALLLLAFLGSCSSIKVPVVNLARGILSLQRPDGAFQSNFGDDGGDLYQHIAFYPGEAMLALLNVYESEPGDSETRQSILEAMDLSFSFYSSYFYNEHPDANYNIWQAQAFRKYWNILQQRQQDDFTKNAEAVASYVVDLGQGIVATRAWKELSRGRPFYPNLSTVEIACGMDALVDCFYVAAKTGNDLEANWKQQIGNAVSFLQWSKDQVPSGVGNGGIGFGGMQVLEQRLDVTGHAISALTKLKQLEQGVV